MDAIIQSVHFSPAGGCTDAVVTALGAAQSEVLVMAYSFTSRPILEALVAAKGRCAVVRIVADEKTNGPAQVAAAMTCSPYPDGIGREELLAAKGSLFAEAVAAGLECWLDGEHQIMHDKVMLIDGRTVVTGSFNWSHNAEAENAENLLVIDSPSWCTVYRENWLLHKSHSIGG